MIYLDNAATTFKKPSCVTNKVKSLIDRGVGNPGRGGHKESERASEAVYSARFSIARLFGAETERVCFTSGCTEALNFAVQGTVLPFSSVITSDIEHNSVIRPLYGIPGCNILKIDTGKDITAQIEKYLSSGVNILVCTAMSNVTGRRLPVFEIGRLCKRYNALFIVDGAQAAGHFDIDVERDCIDILCLPSHKGLFGLAGAGAMIFSKSFDPDRIKPTIVGGSGTESKLLNMPHRFPERLEAGTLPVIPIVSMGKGAEFVMKTGTQKISEHENMLYELLFSCLDEFDEVRIYSKSPGSVLLFNIEGIPSDELCYRLSEYNIAVRGGFHCAPDAHKKTATYDTGAVRVSFSYLNKPKDVYKLVDAVKEIILQYRKGALHSFL